MRLQVVLPTHPHPAVENPAAFENPPADTTADSPEPNVKVEQEDERQ